MVAFSLAQSRGLLGLVALACSLPVLDAAPMNRLDETPDPLVRLARQGLEEFDSDHQGSEYPSHPLYGLHSNQADMPTRRPSPAPFGVLDSTEGSFEYRPQETWSSGASPGNAFSLSDRVQGVGPDGVGPHDSSRHYHAPVSGQGFHQQASTFSQPRDAYSHNDGFSWGSSGRPMQQDIGSSSHLGADQKAATSYNPTGPLSDVHHLPGLERSSRRGEYPTGQSIGHPQGTTVNHQQKDKKAHKSKVSLAHRLAQAALQVKARRNQPAPSLATPTLPALRLPTAKNNDPFRLSGEELLAAIPHLREDADRTALDRIGKDYQIRLHAHTALHDWLENRSDNELWEVGNHVFAADGAVELAPIPLNDNGRIALIPSMPLRSASVVQHDVLFAIIKKLLRVADPGSAEAYTMERVGNEPIRKSTVWRWIKDAPAEQGGPSVGVDFELGSYRLKVSPVARLPATVNVSGKTHYTVLAIPTDQRFDPIHMGYLASPKSESASIAKAWRDRWRNRRER